MLEIVLVLFILGILAATLTPTVRQLVETNQRTAELRTLDALVATITESFENTDLTNLNIAAMPGTIGSDDLPTVFSSSVAAGPTTTATNDWFAKLARLRGIKPHPGLAPSAEFQPALAQIVFNALGNPRWLIAGPVETGQQRFLLLSLMARNDQLSLPPYVADNAWFDAIWDHDWENLSAPPPAAWQANLSAAEFAAWSAGQAGLTRTHRLCVRRIVLPKYRVTINNNHPSEQAFLAYNNVTAAYTAPAGSGTNTTPEILAGRLVSIHRGATPPGTESLRFHLRENTTVTLQ
ncbi:MAG: hypothetical protein H7A44_08490 [Opitutaceae bacterium]|nr:hypothetical protein [Cephaloticoccus sp.]MCP5530468.1 hypothetical protein [Opitutaceae bacterium]